MSKKVKVASIGEALDAGFLPKNGDLVNDKGTAVSQGFFQSIAGSVIEGDKTGNAQFPVVYDGVLLPAELVYKRTKKAVAHQGGVYDVFADGSVQSISGEIYEPGFIGFLAKPESDEDDAE